ncbi:MAG: hypothetical protein JWP71_194 [Mucilaginibacter sp.]|nr:hypothetical protein [Mucilaginibacter sp.]
MTTKLLLLKPDINDTGHLLKIIQVTLLKFMPYCHLPFEE